MLPARTRLRDPVQFQDGIHYDARFNTARGGRCVVKVPRVGAKVGGLTDFFTFTGGNQSLYRGANGLLIPSVTNTPRIEYDSGGNLLGLLIEGARTNLCLQSEVIDNASWTKSGLAGTPVTANATAAPDGATTADKLVEPSGGTFHLVRQDITVSANTAYTFSVFLAAAGRGFARVQLSNSAEANGAYVDVNLTTGALGTATLFGTGSVQVASIAAYANGFYRVTLKCIIDAASTTARVQVLLASAIGTVNYAGDGSSGIYMWGAQLEAGSFPSSYIPTTTVGVARTADTCLRTYGAEFSLLQGTLFADIRPQSPPDSAGSYFVAAVSGTTGRLGYVNGSAIAVRDSATTETFNATSLSAGTAYRYALAYTSASVLAHTVNGAAVESAATAGNMGAGTVLAVGSIDSGGSQLYGHIRRLSYWPERKTNAFLQRVTSLAGVRV